MRIEIAEGLLGLGRSPFHRKLAELRDAGCTPLLVDDEIDREVELLDERLPLNLDFHDRARDQEKRMGIAFWSAFAFVALVASASVIWFTINWSSMSQTRFGVSIAVCAVAAIFSLVLLIAVDERYQNVPRHHFKIRRVYLYAERLSEDMPEELRKLIASVNDRVSGTRVHGRGAGYVDYVAIEGYVVRQYVDYRDRNKYVDRYDLGGMLLLSEQEEMPYDGSHTTAEWCVARW